MYSARMRVMGGALRSASTCVLRAINFNSLKKTVKQLRSQTNILLFGKLDPAFEIESRIIGEFLRRYGHGINRLEFKLLGQLGLGQHFVQAVVQSLDHARAPSSRASTAEIPEG